MLDAEKHYPPEERRKPREERGNGKRYIGG
jgi:hypothetical protein